MDAAALRVVELRARAGLASAFVRPQPAAGQSRLSTGLPAVDTLLGGGFPPGRISEIVGPRSSGRTSLLLGSLARATTGGALVALVDATDGLDPVSARATGVELGRLLWVRCGGQVMIALRAADVILRGGGFGMIAVDLGELPPWTLARVPASAVVRLQRAVEATPAALLFAGSRGVAGSLATVAVALEPGRFGWTCGGPRLLTGWTTRVRLARSRMRAPGASVEVAWGLAPLGPREAGACDA